ncbi:MAG: response regulator [Anaerolineaceae bacterium]|nr:response regulator [Anaerolineaceae bacterium]
MAKLLIIDDDPFITESLKVGLGDHGHQVFAGHNGREGVALVHELTPDLVIIDMTMPIMDGLEATEHIRRDSDVPIIMLTAETDEEDVVAALQTGVDEYLSKPFRLNELAARVHALIRRHHWNNSKIEQEIAQLKHSLMANMTHELRTPIASIQSALEIVFASAAPDNFESQLRFLEQVQHNTYVLNRLVEDLLILAKIDEGLEILRRPFSLHAEIERTIRKKGIEIGERNLTVYNEIEEPLEVNGDTHKLRHLFYHLLDNAIKFSHPNQSIHIWAQTSEQGDLQLVFADQGIGIAPENQVKIFDRFFQLDISDGRSYGGLGIGLTIARAIAEAHGGHITVRSAPNAGSQFNLTLPAAEADWYV